MYATSADVVEAYEGTLDATGVRRAEYLLRVANARLSRLVPGLAERIAEDQDLAVLARDVVVQAVLRQVRNPSPEFIQQTQSAGPFALSVNNGSGNSRGNRGMFYQEELDLLMPTRTGQRVGTIRLGLSDWTAG